MHRAVAMAPYLSERRICGWYWFHASEYVARWKVCLKPFRSLPVIVDTDSIVSVGTRKKITSQSQAGRTIRYGASTAQGERRWRRGGGGAGAAGGLGARSMVAVMTGRSGRRSCPM